MRRLAVILSAAVTVGAGLSAVPAQAATTLPSAPATGYAVFTAPLTVGGSGVRFQTAAGSATGSSLGSGALSVQGTATGGAVAGTSLYPPTGASFAAGTTYRIDETATADTARVSLTGAGASQCSSISDGTLTVHEVTLAGSAVTAFAGSVRGNCGSGQPVFAQEVRWNATVPMIVLEAPVSTPKSETVTVQVGPSAATFGTPVGSGTDAKVRVTANTCTGARAANTTCTLTLTATPDFFGPAQDLVTLPDGGDGRKIPVTSVGYETATGAYTPLKPYRLLDTRKKVGVGTTTPIGSGKYVDLQVSGRGGVPGGTTATAAVLNVTVVAPTTQGYVTLYPTGTSRPTASSVNFNKGWTGANLITVKVGTGGKVRVHNYAGNTHVVVDVMGYYHGSSSTASTNYGGYSGISPTRSIDTRDYDTPLGRDQYLKTGLGFGSSVNPHVKAYAANITVTKPTGTGYLTAWNGNPDAIPSTSTLNFTTGRTVPNMAIVPTSACGADCPDPSTPVIGVLNTSSGSAHVIVDLVGVYDDNTIDGMWRFRPLKTPTRIVNTVKGQGIPAAIGSNKVATVTAPSAVTTYNSMALVTNTTANKPTNTTVLTLWNADITRPSVSNLNPYAGQLVSNMTITDLGVDYDFTVHNAAGSTNLVIDVAGSMETYPAVADPSAGLALRADGLSALRGDSVQRATGGATATPPTFHGTPVNVAPRQR